MRDRNSGESGIGCLIIMVIVVIGLYLIFYMAGSYEISARDYIVVQELIDKQPKLQFTYDEFYDNDGKIIRREYRSIINEYHSLNRQSIKIGIRNDNK